MSRDGAVGVMLTEDDDDFSFLINDMLSAEPDIRLLGRADSPASAVALALETRPDIVLMDLNLTGAELDGIGAAKQIRLLTHAKIIILSSYENEQTVLKASTDCFAANYIYKSNFKLIPGVIRATALSYTPAEMLIKNQILSKLSPAERAIFDSMVTGTEEMKSSPSTVANQKGKVFRKLGVSGQKELMHIFRGSNEM